MKKLFFIGALFLLSFCGSISANNPQDDRQLNISIFLDLSDRINPERTHSPSREPLYPQQWKRDIYAVRVITEIFREDIRSRPLTARNQIRVLFHPIPPNSAINDIAENLRVESRRMSAVERRNENERVFRTLTPLFINNLTKIYTQTIQTNQWIGSDIWRFFQNDVKNQSVANDDNYRNILVILTDGYIFHRQSMYSIQNRHSYLLQRNIGRYRTLDYRERIRNDDFGLIATRNDLHNLEVLVLGISAENSNHRIDENILRFVLGNWFREMNVARYEISNTDLPVRTETIIRNFFNVR